MRYRISLLFVIFVLLTFFKVSLSEEIPTITIEPSSFSKIVIRVPDFKGDKELSTKLTPLLRRLLNYHLFILALKTPPLPNYPSKEYYLKGTIEKDGDKIIIKAELIDTLENRVLNIYKISGSFKYSQRLIYALCDKVVESISDYKGIAYTKIAFVKRTSSGDRLYIADFSKKNPRLLRKAKLILFPKFSRSGKKLAYLVYENKKYFLEVYDFTKAKRKTFFIKGICSTPVWLPNEKELVITVDNGKYMGLYRLNLETGKPLLLIKRKGVLQAGSVSPKGVFLAYVYGKRVGKPQIYLLDFETLKSFRIPQPRAYNTSPRFSPKGGKLLFLSKTGGVSYIVLYNLKTKKLRQIKFLGELEDPAFSPTGDYIMAFGEGRKGEGVYLIHLDSTLTYLYLPGKNFIFIDWGKL